MNGEQADASITDLYYADLARLTKQFWYEGDSD